MVVVSFDGVDMPWYLRMRAQENDENDDGNESCWVIKQRVLLCSVIKKRVIVFCDQTECYCVL